MISSLMFIKKDAERIFFLHKIRSFDELLTKINVRAKAHALYINISLKIISKNLYLINELML